MHAGASAGLRRTMLRAHSAACMRESGAAPEEAQALEAGPPPTPSRAQRQHLYCVLRRCNMIGADGRPRLAPELMVDHRSTIRDKKFNISSTRVVSVLQAASACRHVDGDAPEDEAWKLFFCGCGEGPAPTPAADVTPSANPESPHTDLPNATSSLPTQ
ncbi:hypothetical protein EVAR_100231_1 [Eumeta japonica]|uniref:Uncharacterized protein n=1 Tax=Eumeta variegata TaxID=151549 RepID=A0A4C1ZTD9_EUMVA|nr:hypothetical protein EVAR_100231_1 [Eumeta japonica]